MRYEVWDKQSPINGVDAQKFISIMGYKPEDEVYIIYNHEGNPWIVQTFNNSPYEGSSIEEKAQAHLDDVMQAPPPEPEDETLQLYQRIVDLSYENILLETEIATLKEDPTTTTTEEEEEL